MRNEKVYLVLIALAAGFAFGEMYAPRPAEATNRDMIQLQTDVSRLIESVNNLNTSVEQKHAVLKTLLEQSLDNVNKLSTNMGALGQTVQQVQATTSSRLDAMGTQLQAMVDNMDELKSRLGKINQQMADTQGTLQSIDAKLGGGAPQQPGPSGPQGSAASAPIPAGQSAIPVPSVQPGPPPSADVLYASGRRDFDTGKYDLARQEFADYLKYYPDTDLAGNAEFYEGEISFAQGNYQDAVSAYDHVLLDYPKSFKLAASRLKKGLALLEMGQQAAAIRELREVARRHPGTDEARKANAKLHEIATGGR
ncbi:MAG TPA: tetratricopeptide repeat protein [Candidatus Acidoferrales bacterium]|nr:tetratricopeptide repeat protein [Candidatus Acidoferrales bacterium]